LKKNIVKAKREMKANVCGLNGGGFRPEQVPSGQQKKSKGLQFG
jgi:hypothetical protein